MITKSLSELKIAKEKYESSLANTQIEEEKDSLKKEFFNELRLYLFSSNQIIKETFSTQITPFISTAGGYNGLFKKNSATSITKKTKNDFYNELDLLLTSALYLSLPEEKKEEINLAIYTLKTYYEDELA